MRPPAQARREKAKQVSEMACVERYPVALRDSSSGVHSIPFTYSTCGFSSLRLLLPLLPLPLGPGLSLHLHLAHLLLRGGDLVARRG
jgi:hypothetical protein